MLVLGAKLKSINSIKPKDGGQGMSVKKVRFPGK